MNWLAHAFLSEQDPEFQLGNLLADIIPRPERAGLSPGLQDGMRQHQAIDAFTDRHPLVLRSRARISPQYRRYSGILVDIFYDHFLAREWESYAPEPLDVFACRLYADVAVHIPALPPLAQMAVQRMIERDHLGSYRQLDGVEAALKRVSARMQQRAHVHLPIDASLPELTQNDQALAADFAEFFPDLCAHVAALQAAPPVSSGRG